MVRIERSFLSIEIMKEEKNNFSVSLDHTTK